MNAYFFKMSKEDRDNILDQHKEVYNGYTMQNQTQSNQQPLYVQDFANDKLGINLDIHGNAKPYTNFAINESHSGLDMIGDGDVDLKNGTVDFDDVLSHNDDYGFGIDYPETDSYENNVMVGDDDDTIYISLGEMDDMIGGGDDDLRHGTFGFEEKEDEKLFDEDDLFDDEIYENKDEELSEGEDLEMEYDLDEEEINSITESIDKTLDMFRRFKKY